jgi:TRAP-type C4-dicarboxylate transport system permease small subunit
MNIVGIRKQLLTITSYLLGLALSVLVLLECVEVVLRYGFSTTLLWSADVSALLLLSLGWLGAGHLWIAGNHLVVDLFQGRFPHFFKWTSALAEVVVLVCIIWLAPKLMDTVSIYADMVMPAIDMSASIRFVPSMIGLFLISLGSILNLSEFLLSADSAKVSP